MILVAGVNGSGKTTSIAKLAHILSRNGEKVIVAACDTFRAAAVEQLSIWADRIGVQIVKHKSGADPGAVAFDACEAAVAREADFLILDTAGRLHIDEALMLELKQVADAASPHQIYLVCDAMTGQDAVNSASAFNERLELDGVILTKLDGDTRGGAAISVKAVTGKPIKFVGVGEKLDDLEAFHPDRMASRILGMGDVVSLVEKAKDVIDQDVAAEQMKKLLEAQFTLQDFMSQVQTVKKLGSIKDILGHLPGGMGAQFDAAGVDEKSMVHLEAMVQSMTLEERLKPEVFTVNRKRRVARGSGTTLADVNDLLKQFHQMKTMMKKQKGQLGGMMGGMMDGMMGKVAQRFMPGMKGAAAQKTAMIEQAYAGGKLSLEGHERSEMDRKKKRTQRKAERKRRKKGRKR